MLPTRTVPVATVVYPVLRTKKSIFTPDNFVGLTDGNNSIASWAQVFFRASSNVVHFVFVTVAARLIGNAAHKCLRIERACGA